MIIGVFDSGVGGQAVATAVAAALPMHSVQVRNDRANVPYGTKTAAQLLQLVTPLLQSMVDDGCRVIVVACNTVSTTIIAELRQLITVPLVAMEPMIKPAAQLTTAGIIAVCATPTTLASQRYALLKQHYATGITVLEPDCSNWSTMIETDQLDVRAIAATINQTLDAGADVIVLGCTHYHWIQHEIQVLCNDRAIVLQPEQPVIAELTRVLARLV